MSTATVARRSVTWVVYCAIGAVVGFFVPSVAWDLAGIYVSTVVGVALVGLGLYLTRQNRAVAFATGLWPLALVSTLLTVLIAWGASSMP
jgi:hypothetical protein